VTFDGSKKDRVFNPYTGEDLGDAIPLGILIVSKLLELHDDLLGGDAGRSINGIGAILLLVLTFTGMVVWWPGIKTWKRSLIVHRKVGWRRFTWELHRHDGDSGRSASFAVWTQRRVPCLPQRVSEPGRIAFSLRPTPMPATESWIRSPTGWLICISGRINGIGIPCHGPGLCDQLTKFVWALAGLTPAAMFVTGVMMWWNRVLRKKLTKTEGR
jgi:uncharacterized iron-regulated membrane protein